MLNQLFLNVKLCVDIFWEAVILDQLQHTKNINEKYWLYVLLPYFNPVTKIYSITKKANKKFYGAQSFNAVLLSNIFGVTYIKKCHLQIKTAHIHYIFF